MKIFGNIKKIINTTVDIIESDDEKKLFDANDIDYKKRKKEYEIKEPSFERLTRPPLEMFESTKALRTRFKRKKEAFYTDGKADTGQASISIVGDLMCSERLQKAAIKGNTYDFKPSFKYVRPIFLKSDLVIGNFETVLSHSAPFRHELTSADLRIDGKPHHNSPVTYLDALKYAKFDVLTTANNHIMDCAYRGLCETLNHIEKYDFIHTGSFRHEKEKRHTIIKVNGIKIGLLAYSSNTLQLGCNGKEKSMTQKGVDTVLNFCRPEFEEEVKRMQQDVDRLRKDGAEFIIVSLHCGIEYAMAPVKRQEDTVKLFSEAGVDFLACSHTHTLQSYDIVENSKGHKTHVVYSMGNFISSMVGKRIEGFDRIALDQAAIFNIDLKRDGSGKVSIVDYNYIPCKVEDNYDGEEFVILPLVAPFNKSINFNGQEKNKSQIASYLGSKIKCYNKTEEKNMAANANKKLWVFIVEGDTKFHNTSKYYIRGITHGIDVKLFIVQLCAIKDGKLYYDGKLVNDLPHIVLSFNKVFRPDLTNWLIEQPVRIINRPPGIPIRYRNKVVHQKLLEGKVRMPKTLEYDKMVEFKEIAKILPVPFVAKAKHGAGGTSVWLVHNEEEYKKLFVHRKIEDMMFQEFIKATHGVIYRINTVGDKVRTVIKCVGEEGDFRANLSLGGIGYKESITPEQEKIVIETAKLLYGEVLGFDYLIDGDELVFCEANTSPQNVSVYVDGFDLDFEIEYDCVDYVNEVFKKEFNM
ncbi:MAG: CapA family protein [Firmicutes bacterium]|nr:CapA family protein [Bacillota bacterium]